MLAVIGKTFAGLTLFLLALILLGVMISGVCAIVLVGSSVAKEVTAG